MEEIKEEILKVASMPECMEKHLLLNALIDYIIHIKDNDIINIKEYCLN